MHLLLAAPIRKTLLKPIFTHTHGQLGVCVHKGLVQVCRRPICTCSLLLPSGNDCHIHISHELTVVI